MSNKPLAKCYRALTSSDYTYTTYFIIHIIHTLLYIWPEMGCGWIGTPKQARNAVSEAWPQYIFMYIVQIWGIWKKNRSKIPIYIMGIFQYRSDLWIFYFLSFRMVPDHAFSEDCFSPRNLLFQSWTYTGYSFLF